ncbi:Fic family protein [Paeniglutamicibacter sp. ABSL32-1]|uniref:Fic/DOC family protein n=1 Tax=Paeniglutamicibacter quisquiliarum TaxID=2849498 RepID=UPI001C2DB1BF|nr:Fic family protein [Paeniglutamicibacter quisquiliarum]
MAARVVQLLNGSVSIAATRDLREMQGIHRHIFGDIFSWAGTIRITDLARADNEPFCPVFLIERAAASVAQQLSDDEHLKGLDHGAFVNKLSYYYNSVNYIHPFREGNGRTQREFLNRVADSAGWFINWGAVYGDQLNETSRLARENLDLDPLIVMFRACVSPVAG